MSTSRERVVIVGSGNWGSTIAKIVGQNCRINNRFEETVRMWVFEEMVNGRKLTEIINTEHENPKYLPGIKIPTNVVAIPNLGEAVQDATVLIFVMPHQFLQKTCETIKGKVPPNCKAISLLKGMQVTREGPELLSDMITKILNIECCVLMGANIANEVAKQLFSEATIGYKSRETGELFRDLFNTHYFHVNIVEGIPGVEMCGALKNIVALAAGFVDGLGYPGNTKVAIIRLGLVEMRRFCRTFFKGVQDEIFFESCGMADLMVTCLEGRNRKCAEAFVKTGKTFPEIEKELLNGQKLQGTLTAEEVYFVLSEKNLTHKFPLFTTVYEVAFKGLPPADFLHKLSKSGAI